MTENLPRNIEEQIENVWYRTQEKVIQEKLRDVERTMGGKFTVDQVVSKVEDFNSTISLVLGDDEQTYNECKMRMFIKDCDVVILQNPEVISEIDQIYALNGIVYQLIEYNEIDVDVRHYGKE